MSTPQMQPERQNKPGKAGKAEQGHKGDGKKGAGKRRRLDGDPNQQVTVSLSWSASGVTATFPANQSPSSGTWDSTAMTARGSTVLVGSGRLTTNAMSVVINGSTYSNSSISDGSSSAVLDQV